MLAARRVGVGAGAPRGPRQITPKLPPYIKSLLHLPPRPTAADARLRLFLAPRPDLQPLYVVPSRFFSQPRRRNARVNTNARVRDNLRLLQRTPDDADLARAIFQDIQAEDGAMLNGFAATAIASSLLQAGAVGESVEVLEYARDKRVRAFPRVYIAVISAATKKKQHAALMRVWDALPDGHYKPFPWEYTSALVAAVRLKQKNQVFEILDKMKANEVEDDKIYGRVIAAACQTKQHELVCEILDYMHASGVDTAGMFVSARRLALKSGEYDFVLQLLRLMKTHGMDPTEGYRYQIWSLHKAGLHDLLQSVFEAMRKAGCVRDEEMYGAAADSAIRVKNRDFVMSILDDMKRDAELSKTPTAVFPRAVGVAVRTSQHQLVLDVFDFMHRTDMDASAAYVTATRTAFKSKQYDFVFDILRKMTENGVDASGEYSHAVMSFSKLECFEHVLRAFKGMRECGYEGGEGIVTTAVEAAIKLERHEDVMAICNHDGRQYTFALGAAVRLKQKKQVFEILDEVKVNEVKVNEVKDDNMYGRVVGAACQAKQHELVCEILDYMHANGVDCTSAYVRARRLAFKSGKYDFALELLRLMKTHGVDPTEQYKHHLMSLHKAGLHDRVQSVLEAMRKEGCVCDDDMYKTAVDSAIRERNRDLVMSILDDMKRNADLSKTPTAVFPRAVEAAELTNENQFNEVKDDNMYGRVVGAACQAKQHELVCEILDYMHANGVDCTKYKHQIRSLHKAGLHDRVLSVFESMRKEGCVCDKDMYMTAIDSAIRVNNSELLMSILDDMKRKVGLAKTRAAVFRTAFKSKQYDFVFDILRKMTENGVDASSACLQGYARTRRYNGNLQSRWSAVHICTSGGCPIEAEEAGVACITKQHELVCEILDYMHANGVDTAGMYVSARRLAFKSGEYDFVLELLRLMQKHGRDPTEDYKHQLMSLHKAGLHDRLQSVFEAMRKAGCVSDEDTYETAVDSAIRVKNRELLISILDDMKCNASLSRTPTAVFHRAVGAAVWTNQPQLLFDVFDFMDHTDTATSAVYTSGIRSAFKAKQYDFVFDILRKMTENGVDASGEYSHAVMSFSKLECFEHVLRAFKGMRECGYEGGEGIVTTAVEAAIKLERHEDVMAICNGLSGKPSVTTPLHSHALEQAHSTNKQGLVDSILQRIKKFTTGVE
ncbi:hypothetical protein PF002_g15051 [Phytophthora fragariae]|uniref:Pentacotripeptide-repeat region of PRORP domain-containing protein n=1 Tax=Phytophthora fragariae TaxID=53985 RepID=A0A6A3YTJ3_9STRA|nr:hypothetical protein PF002_g15051 [Phytophthora fragariae]